MKATKPNSSLLVNISGARHTWHRDTGRDLTAVTVIVSISSTLKMEAITSPEDGNVQARKNSHHGRYKANFRLVKFLVVLKPEGSSWC
jgi:hypothetical protein